MSTDNNDPDSVREKREAEDRWESSQRRHRFFTIACVLLTAAVVSLAWYAYPILKRHDAFMTQLSGAQLPENLHKLTASVDDRLHQMEVRISDWRTNRQEFRDQLSELRRHTQERLDTAQQQTGELFRGAQSRIDSEIEGVKATLARIESSKDDEQTRVAALQQELTEVRQAVAQQGDDLSAVRRRMDENAANSQQQIASLQESQQRDRHDVDAIAGSLAVKRIDFELTAHRSQELAPGISNENHRNGRAFRSGQWVDLDDARPPHDLAAGASRA